MTTLVSYEPKLLSSKVGAECDSRDAEAGEGASEALEPGEGTCVPPLLTVGRKYIVYTPRYSSVLSCPWVVLGAIRGGCGELLGVEAGDGGASHGEGAVAVS